jgi:YD repeat-containing protein
LSVGSFTIGYSYNLAGEITSVADPFSAAINYAYDATGQLLTEVTSTGTKQQTYLGS